MGQYQTLPGLALWIWKMADTVGPDRPWLFRQRAWTA